MKLREKKSKMGIVFSAERRWREIIGHERENKLKNRGKKTVEERCRMLRFMLIFVEYERRQ